MAYTPKQIYDLNHMNVAAQRALLGTTINELLNSSGGFIETPKIVHVNKANSKATEDGSLNFPYKTIQAAIDNAEFGSNIEIAPNEYDEEVLLINKHNLTIYSPGNIGQYRVVVSGGFRVTGNSTRIGVSNIQVDGEYFCDTPGGLVYLDNVAVNGDTTLSGSGYHRYDYCFFNGLSHSGDAFIDIRNSQCEDNSIWQVTNPAGTLSVIGVTGISINHVNGNLYIGGDTIFVPHDSSNTALTSTSDTGGIRFDGGTFLQANGSFAKINKTGTCPYSLSTIVYEPSISLLNGVRIDGGLHSDQIYDHSTRIGYTKADDTLAGHLTGIADAFIALQDRVTALE